MTRARAVISSVALAGDRVSYKVLLHYNNGTASELRVSVPRSEATDVSRIGMAVKEVMESLSLDERRFQRELSRKMLDTSFFVEIDEGMEQNK